MEPFSISNNFSIICNNAANSLATLHLECPPTRRFPLLLFVIRPCPAKDCDSQYMLGIWLSNKFTLKEVCGPSAHARVDVCLRD